jgi:hypothetical protein
VPKVSSRLTLLAAARSATGRPVHAARPLVEPPGLARAEPPLEHGSSYCRQVGHGDEAELGEPLLRAGPPPPGSPPAPRCA